MVRGWPDDPNQRPSQRLRRLLPLSCPYPTQFVNRMVQPRRKRLFVLSVAASCGIAAAGTLAVQHGEMGTPPAALQQTASTLSASAAVRGPATATVESAWQQVGWNDDSSSGSGATAAGDNTTPRQPVVTAVLRRALASTKTGPGAPKAGTSATGAADSTGSAAAPTWGNSVFGTIADPPAAPSVATSATNQNDATNAVPAAPVVRVVQAPRLPDLSVLEVGPSVDRGAEEAEEDAPSNGSAAAAAEPVATTPATTPSAPTVSVALPPAVASRSVPAAAAPEAATTAPSTAVAVDDAKQPLKTDAASSESNAADELFGPPPVPRGTAPMSRGMSRRLAKAAQTPAAG